MTPCHMCVGRGVLRVHDLGTTIECNFCKGTGWADAPPRLTVASTAGFRPGDSIRFSDNRRWWVKLWHWVIRKKVNRDFRITAVKDGTTLMVKS